MLYINVISTACLSWCNISKYNDLYYPFNAGAFIRWGYNWRSLDIVNKSSPFIANKMKIYGNSWRNLCSFLVDVIFHGHSKQATKKKSQLSVRCIIELQRVVITVLANMIPPLYFNFAFEHTKNDFWFICNSPYCFFKAEHLMKCGRQTKNSTFTGLWYPWQAGCQSQGG